MRNFIFCLLAMFSFTSWVSAQSISGKVLDENGLPLPGVNVTVGSSAGGTVTNIDGVFNINAKAGDQLKFTFVGYSDLTATAAANMTVSLKPSATDLSEVVVIGYGTQRKADVTGSIAVVDKKDFMDRPNASAMSSLQGKVAGVNIVNSGAPGSQPDVQIRGIGSISGRDILYVVDGVLTTNISYLNPADIDSMSILKDASSLAIYGIRSANGVIIITTKTGKKGERINFTYDGSVGFQKTTNVPKYANGADYVRLYNEKLQFEGNTNPANVLDPAQFNGVSTDWLDEILRDTSITTTQNVGVTGSTDKSTFALSMGYFYQMGLLDAGKGVNSGEDYKRSSIRFQDRFEVSSKFRIGGSIAYTKSDANNSAQPFQVARITPSIIPVYNADGSYGFNSDLGTAGNNNARKVLDEFRGKTAITRTLLNAFAEYDLVKGLTYRLSVSRDFEDASSYTFTPVVTTLGTTITNPSKLTKLDGTVDDWLTENTLTYNLDFGKSRLTALAGASREIRKTRNSSFSVNDVPFTGDDATLYLDLGNQTTLTNNLANQSVPGLQGNEIRYQSYFGRIQYAFDDKYLINGTVRRDGASVYQSNDSGRSATFPSVGIGWVISKESFMAKSGLDFLKIKASWGQLGNATISRQFDETITNQPAAFFGNPSTQSAAASVTQLVDTSINWEVVTGTDIGFELRALNNRLSVEAGYYRKETKDGIFNITNLPTSGLGGTLYTNAGSFVNKGIEFTASWNDRINDQWSYSVYGNFTTIKNEITEVLGRSFFNTGPGLFGNPIKRYEVGHEVGAYYGFVADGVVQNAAESAETGVPVGGLKFKDENNDGVIDDQDKRFLGSPIPDVTYGFGLNLKYTNFDLGMEFQGVAGNEIYNFNRNSRFGNENWDQDFVDNHWTTTNPSNTYPAPNSDQNSSRPSSFYVEKGDYFRIRLIQLGYTLPESLLKTLKIERLRFYVSAQNPFTAFKYNGFSPELGSQTIDNLGIDNNAYPLSAIYSFGINFNF